MLAIARGVCGALAEAHAMGIVHRDLKPANIFLTANDSVKVLDFGIAKILASSEVSDPRELTRMGTAVGTVEYMAPEQLMGGKADPRTDLYTLGVVMYEMITGRRPFNASGLDLLTEQLTSTPAPPSSVADVPPEIDAMLLSCLANEVDDRFASARELARAIDAALAAHPEVAAAPPPPAAYPAAAPFPSFPPELRGPAPRDMRSMRWTRLAIVAVVLVAGVVAAIVALIR